MAYSFAQLEGLWEQAGGSHALAPVMAAIALAESGGNPNATGGVGEKGLWQINPKVWGSLATYDPLGNARAAVHVQKSQGLGAWTTYNDGAYKHFLSSAKPAAPPSGTGQAPGTTTAAGRGSGGTTGGAGSQGTSTGSGSTGGGGLAGWWDAVYAGLKAGLGISGASGNIIAQDTSLVASGSDVAQAIAALTLPFTVFANFIDWFFVPSHWIRIAAGLGGIVLGAGGVYELAHAGDDHPTALPAGIAMTGAGGVLLFVAFHNLDPSIKTVGELLADLQGKVQTGAGATTSPQAAVTAAGG